MGIECAKCGAKNTGIAKNLKCSKCGTEYVYNKEQDSYFFKYAKCRKCGQESGTITKHYVCDKCGTEYVFDAIGASIFVRKEDFYPLDSVRYMVGGIYYSGFWAKIAGLFFGLLFAYMFFSETEFAWLGWISLLVAAGCAFLLVRGYLKYGPRGFFGLKKIKLSKEALEIKKKAEQRAAKKAA